LLESVNGKISEYIRDETENKENKKVKDGKCMENIRVSENRVLRDREWTRLVGILVVEMVD